MVIHYPPERLRRNSDQPTAITNALIATSGSSSRTGDIPLGTPTCSARSRRGRWALYPNGEEVVVVWPGGAVVGPAVEVAGELDRLGGGQDYLDRAAVSAIRRFLTDPAAEDGARVRAFEITELTTENYHEMQIGDLPILTGSGTAWNKDGMHHIDPHKINEDRWIACVDGWHWDA